jgi:hypothetical protein
MADIIHRVGIQATVNKVYKALSTIQGLSYWWTQEVKGEEKVGGKITFTFRSLSGNLLGEMVMEIMQLDAAKEVEWKCIEGPPEWIGTAITFQWSLQDNQVILLFGHRNWKEPVEFMAHCSMKWAVFLLSLRAYIETGLGSPSPHDLKIDNWN